jgi:hypothetical protein
VVQETARRAVQSVQTSLPPGWLAALDREGGVLTVSAPRTSARFAVVVGRSGTVPADALASAAQRPGTAGLIYLAPYVSPAVREKLARAGVSYADGTGWVRMVSDQPMLAITAQGASKAPAQSGSQTITHLGGRAAGRIVRAALGSPTPVGVRQLATLADVSPGTVSKTLPALAADNALERDSAGSVTSVDRRRLLDRWTADYGLLKSNGTPSYYVAPRGIGSVLEKTQTLPGVALTGGRAGQACLPEGVAPTLPTTQIVLYAADPTSIAETLDLVETDPPSANVIVLAPQDPAILDNPGIRAGLPVAPLPVVLADLLTLPGRYPAQAVALMDALAKTNPEWRP